MKATLRQIADGVWKARGGGSADERQRIYDRARMLRDKGLIATSQPRSQGKTTTYTDADIASAVVNITANLNGNSWGIIQALNDQLRTIGNTMGSPKYEFNVEAIKRGEPIYARLDLRLEPWPHAHARMGGLEVIEEKYAEGTTQVLIWPVTDLSKPVLDILDAD